jgi:CHASE2 domain-containing sensor protein
VLVAALTVLGLAALLRAPLCDGPICAALQDWMRGLGAMIVAAAAVVGLGAFAIRRGRRWGTFVTALGALVAALTVLVFADVADEYGWGLWVTTVPLALAVLVLVLALLARLRPLPDAGH